MLQEAESDGRCLSHCSSFNLYVGTRDGVVSHHIDWLLSSGDHVVYERNRSQGGGELKRSNFTFKYASKGSIDAFVRKLLELARSLDAGGCGLNAGVDIEPLRENPAIEADFQQRLQEIHSTNKSKIGSQETLPK